MTLSSPVDLSAGNPATPAPGRRTAPSTLRRKRKDSPNDENHPAEKPNRTTRATVRDRVPLQNQQETTDSANQAVLERIAELEAQLAREVAVNAEMIEENKKISKELENANTQLEDVNRHLVAKDTDEDDETERDQLLEHIEVIEEELNEKNDKISELEEALASIRSQPSSTSEAAEVADGSIVRPRGTAGTDWSIQAQMGLGNSSKNAEFFKSIQRRLRDAAIGAHLDWTGRWSDIPMVDKAKFFLLMRNQIPYLKRFQNDWATEEIVKQYFANKRKNHYKNNWLPVPERYAHLKATSAKRNPNGSRVKRVKTAQMSRTRRREQQDEGHGDGDDVGSMGDNDGNHGSD
ncbi:hypothetical protein H0H93_000840, partial [Arthromyces matolae]